jgi:hypothetical protein
MLHFIPPGCTDERQPLDRDVFGALKYMYRRPFQRFAMGCKENGSGQWMLLISFEKLGTNSKPKYLKWIGEFMMMHLDLRRNQTTKGLANGKMNSTTKVIIDADHHDE